MSKATRLIQFHWNPFRWNTKRTKLCGIHGFWVTSKKRPFISIIHMDGPTSSLFIDTLQSLTMHSALEVEKVIAAYKGLDDEKITWVQRAEILSQVAVFQRPEMIEVVNLLADNKVDAHRERLRESRNRLEQKLTTTENELKEALKQLKEVKQCLSTLVNHSAVDNIKKEQDHDDR
ncbi:hypothetical protein GR11A_00237 [Vibrio phage vB_VcorM_GR11A]|nr:hypothetical protein GR11A_00237 [Vibrio phage vB_VcorM_GR11A]